MKIRASYSTVCENELLSRVLPLYDIEKPISCRFWQGASDRYQGKLFMMQSALTEAEIKSAIVVTDSKDDLPLLQVVAHPCLALWPDAEYVNPFNDFWLYALLKRLKH